MNSNSDLKAYTESLSSRIWITKGSRFNAARRLNNKYQFSLNSISILSVYGIAIPIIQGIVRNPQCQKINEIYNAISLILSVFTLAISLLEGAKNYQIKAEKLHKNAVEISSLQRELEYLMISKSGEADFLQKLGDISVKYEHLIERCPENHEPEDYDFFMAQNRKDFKISRLAGFYIRIKLIIKDYWLYIFVLGIPPTFFLLYSSC
ncbi:SLATT domain-containing protein [Nostoc sp. CCCryo 231-06]|nr:SLATT domain-containing protein [Nostoc sp. CCCryo 231-06]